MTPNIKVLFLCADPRNVGYRPDLDKEISHISKGIRTAKFYNCFKLESEWSVGPSDLQEALLRHEPDIVHFSGHGNAKGIILQNSFGRSTSVSKKALSSLFKLNKGRIRIVVLNACYSKTQVDAFTETIDFTIGMMGTVTDKIAITFSAAFYRALAFGRSVNDAFESAKLELHLLKVPKSKTPELFVRKGADASAPFVAQLSSTAKSEKLKEKADTPKLIGGISVGRDVKKSALIIRNGAIISWGKSDSSDNYLKAIGRITINFQCLELFISIFIWNLMGLDHHSGTIITSQLSFNRLCNLFTSLSRERVRSPEAIRNIETLLKKAAKAERKRNSITHSYWGVVEESDGTYNIIGSKVTAKRRSGLNYQFPIVKVNRLEEIADIIGSITIDLCDLMEEMRKAEDVNYPNNYLERNSSQ